jgi:hypothetical protein
MRLIQLFENTNDILQPTNLSPKDLQRFNRAVEEWLATRPWTVDVTRLNEIVDFYNRVDREGIAVTSPLLPKLLNYIKQHPGRDAQTESQQVKEQGESYGDP